MSCSTLIHGERDAEMDCGDGKPETIMGLSHHLLLAPNCSVQWGKLMLKAQETRRPQLRP